MEEETGRHVVSLPGVSELGGAGAGTQPQKTATLLRAQQNTTHVIPQPTLGMRWAVPTLQVGESAAGRCLASPGPPSSKTQSQPLSRMLAVAPCPAARLLAGTGRRWADQIPMEQPCRLTRACL